MMVYYVMLRGVDRFRAEYNAYPGEFDDQVEPDIVKLKVQKCPEVIQQTSVNIPKMHS